MTRQCSKGILRNVILLHEGIIEADRAKDHQVHVVTLLTVDERPIPESTWISMHAILLACLAPGLANALKVGAHGVVAIEAETNILRILGRLQPLVGAIGINLHLINDGLWQDLVGKHGLQKLIIVITSGHHCSSQVRVWCAKPLRVLHSDGFNQVLPQHGWHRHLHCLGSHGPRNLQMHGVIAPYRAWCCPIGTWLRCSMLIYFLGASLWFVARGIVSDQTVHTTPREVRRHETTREGQQVPERDITPGILVALGPPTEDIMHLGVKGQMTFMNNVGNRKGCRELARGGHDNGRIHLERTLLKSVLPTPSITSGERGIGQEAEVLNDVIHNRKLRICWSNQGCQDERHRGG
mmetsp:Transcript_10197/g.22996  ORF Transcript_10197/g.22996 Transcript_10197/m.22996 type:complete len:352 (+) Transcript_10197:332-1387(+)